MKYCVVVFCFFLIGCCAFANQSLGPNGSNALTLHQLGFRGQGVSIGLLSANNTLATHNDFRDANGISHVFANNATNDGQGILTSNHDTWVAGIAVGRGDANHPDDFGAAPAADLYSERVVTTTGSIAVNFLQTALDDAITSHNCRIIFSGIQLTDTADGTNQFALIYDYYANNNNVVFANPAGNYYTNGTTTSTRITTFGDACNGITTGGLINTDSNNTIWGQVGSSSNLGPTIDGRRKPDLTAPSQNQIIPNGSGDSSWINWTSAGGETSFSVPQVAGVSALLLSYADTTSDTADNQNEVIRAVIVNSTMPNINDNNALPTTGSLWNVARGYGRVDAYNAYTTLSAPKITAGNGTTAIRGWAYNSLTTTKNSTGIHNYSIYALKNQRLAATLTWNRQVTRSGFAGFYTYSPPSTATNLYLQIIDPNGRVDFSDTGNKDNLKRCDFIVPNIGYYQIRITNSTRTTQDYGLAFQIICPLIGDFDLNYRVDYLDMLSYVDTWLNTGSGLSTDLAAPFGQIDFPDFAVFSENWLFTNKAYFGHP